MTQTKTVENLHRESIQTQECWCMQAAVKTIMEAGLQDRYRFHLAEIARREGSEDVLKELAFSYERDSAKK